MNNKIICILICTLVIATSTVVTVRSGEFENIALKKIENIDFSHIESIDQIKSNYNNFSTLGSGFEECVAACMGITLAGNCIYLIFGCAISPGPHNFCCWAAPIFCGVDIGLLLTCIAKCAEQPGDLYDEPPCFPPYVIRLIRLMQNNNSSGPAIILGLMCLLQHIKQVLEWLKEKGILNIEIPNITDCGCDDEY